MTFEVGDCVSWRDINLRGYRGRVTAVAGEACVWVEWFFPRHYPRPHREHGQNLIKMAGLFGDAVAE